MIETPDLVPADHDDIAFALSFALRHDGRRRFRQADETMANVTAEHLIRQLERSGFVLMRRVRETPGPAPEMRPFALPEED